MPPVVVFMLSALGAAALARFVYREARRVNASLHPQPQAPVDERNAARKLVRDPKTGVYRPG